MNETTNIRKKKNKNSINNYMNNNNFNNMNNNAQNSYNKNMDIDEYGSINPIFKIHPFPDNSQNNNYNKYQSNNNQINSQNNNFQNSNNIINNSNYNMNNNYYNNNSNVNYMNNQNNSNFNDTNINYNNINYNNYNNNGNFNNNFQYNNNYNINNLNSINPDTDKVFSRKQSNNINNMNNQNMFNFKAMMNPVSKKSNSNINNNQNMFNNNNNNIINNGNFNNGFNNNPQNIFQNNNFQNTMQNNQNNILNVMNMTSRKYPSNNNNRNMFNYNNNMIVEQYNNNINNQNQFDVNKGIANISFTGSADIVDIINDKVEDLKKQCQKRPLTIILTVDEKYKDSFFTGYIKKCLIDNRGDLIIKVKEKINEKTFKTTKYGLKENKEMIATPELLETEGENRVNNLHEFQQIKEHAIDLGDKAITFESDIESVFPNYFRLFENSSWLVKGGIDKMIEDICKKENKNHEEYKRVLQNMRDPEKLLCDYTHEDITIMCDIADHISSNNYDEIIFPKDTENLPKICLVGDLLSSRPLLNNEDVYIPGENSDSHAPGIIKGIGGRSFTVFDIKKDENGSFQTTINKIIDTGKITKCCVNFLNKLNNKLNEDAFKYGKEILYVLFRKNNYIMNNMDDTSFFNVCKGIYNNQNEISPTDTRKFLEKINFYNIAGNHEYGFSKSKGITGEYDIFGVFDENRNKNKVKISNKDFVEFREELDKNGFKLVHRPEHCIYDICYKEKTEEDNKYFKNYDINEIDKQKINLLNKIPLFRSLNFSSNNNLFVAKHTDYFPLGFVKTDLKAINIDNDDCLNLLRQQKDYISDRSYNKLFNFYIKKEKKNLDTINYDSEHEETIDNIMKDIFLIYGHNHNFYTKVNDQIEKLVPADTQNREQKIQEIKNKIANNEATEEQRQAIQGLFKNKLCIDIDNIENKDHFQNCKNRNNPSFTLKNGEITNELLNFRLNGEKDKIFNLLKTEEQMKKEECQRIIPNAFKDCQDKSLTFTDIKPGTKIKASSDLEGNFIHFIFFFITGGAMDKDKLKLLSDKTKELLGLDKNGNIKEDLIKALQEYDKFIQNNCGCIKESSVFYDESKFLLGHAYNKFQTPQCKKLINDINQYLKPISQYSDEDFEAIREDKINIVSAIKEIEGDQILLLLGDTLSLRVFKNSSNLGPFKIDKSEAIINFSDLPLNNTEQLEQKAKEVRQICDNFLLTYELIVDMLEQMKNKNPKKFLNLIGNHDITSTLDKIKINFNVDTRLLSKKQAEIVNDLYCHLRNYVNQRIRKYKERILKLSDFTVIYKTNHKKPHEILYSHTTNRINASKDGEEKYPLAKFLRKNDDDKLFHIDGAYGFKESFLTYPNKPLEALYKYYTWDNNKDDQHFQEKHKEETHKYLQERNRTIIYGHQHKAIGQLLSKKLPEYGRLLNTDCHTFEFGMFYTIQTEITDKGLRHSYLNGITGNEVRSIKNENNKITEVSKKEMENLKKEEEQKRKQEEEQKIEQEKKNNKNIEKIIQNYSDKIVKLKDDFEKLEEKNKELQDSVNNHKAKSVELNKQIKSLQDKVKDMDALRLENNNLKNKTEEIEKIINKSKETIKQKKQVLEDVLKNIEKSTKQLKDIEERTKQVKELDELLKDFQESQKKYLLEQKEVKLTNELKEKFDRYSKLYGSLCNDVEKYNTEIKLLKRQLDVKQNEIKKLQKNIKEKEEIEKELNDLKNKNKEYKEIKENNKQIEELKQENNKLKNKVKELNIENNKIAQIAKNLESDNNTLNKEINENKNKNKTEIIELQNKIQEGAIEEEKIEKELNDLKNTNEKNKKTIEELKEKIVKNEKTIIDLNKEKEKNENKIKELNKVVKENDELKKKVEELNNKNNEIAKTVKSLELENNTLNRKIDEDKNKNKKEIIELQNKIKEGATEKEKMINELKEKIEKNETEIKELTQKNNELKEDGKTNENKIKDLSNKIKEKEETITKLKEKITENETKINELNNEIKLLKDKVKDMDALQLKNDKLKKKVEELKKDITKNKEKIEKLNTEINKYKTEQKNIENELKDVRNENNRLHTVNRKLTNELNRFRASTTLVRSGNNNIFSGHNKNNKYDKPTIVEISDKEREELGKKPYNIIINNTNVKKNKINLTFTDKDKKETLKEDEKENKKLELENLKLGLGSPETAKEIKLETQNYNDFDKSNNKKYMQIKLFNNELFNNTFKHLNIKEYKKETLKEDEKDKVNNDLKKIAEESNKDKPKTNISRMNEFFYNNNNKTSISSNKYSIFDRNKPITINSKTAEKQISNGPIKIKSKTAEKQIITLKNIEDKKEKIEDKKEININIEQSTTYPMHNNSNKNKFERYDANTSYISRKRFDDIENKMRKIINNSQQCNEYNIEKYPDKCPFFK